MGTSLYRSLLLSTAGFTVSDYVQKFTINDNGVRPKVTICDPGTQVPDEVSGGAKDDRRVVAVSKKPVKTTGHGTKSSVSSRHGDRPQGGSGAGQGSNASFRPREVMLRSREPTRTQTFDRDGWNSGPASREGGDCLSAEGVAVEMAEAGHWESVVVTEPERIESTPFVQKPVAMETQPGRREGWREEGEGRGDVATVTEQQRNRAKAASVPGPDLECEARCSPSLSQGEPVLSGTTGMTQTEPGRHGETSDEDRTLKRQTVGQISISRAALTTRVLASQSQSQVIDDCPPTPAPFTHRIVSVKQAPMSPRYAVQPNKVLGGGRFGQVHRCAELSSGLTLAAKIIKVKGMKDRDEVKNEISVMNQLDHVNLIQLYDAFESGTNLTLIMEYVEGGELFDRIVNESYSLTELDAIVFMRQICEGVQYLHRQYILHLDLKPENILCVNSTGNQIKIIDFGLARKYKPQEKLKVNFGTPEFVAPEVINYELVSFPTDMWSVGVITYMLLSGLSPFLGDDDTETMNNILHSNWDFDAEAFENVSEEAKDFVSRLLIPEKCSRLSASGCLKQAWLSRLEERAERQQVRLKSQLRLQHYLAAHRQWKKHFHAVAAANRLRKLQEKRPTNQT